MAATNLTVELPELPRVFEGMGREFNGMDLRPPLRECRVLVSADIKRNFDESHDPDGNPWAALKFNRPRGGNKPLRDRGLLMAGAGATGRPEIDELTNNSLTMGTNQEHAGIHQHGGTIRPKGAKALAIPLTREAVRSGGPRQMSGLFLFKGRRHAFLAESRGRGRGKRSFTELTLHWLLLSSVTITARPFMGVGEKLGSDIETVFANSAERALEDR